MAAKLPDALDLDGGPDVAEAVGRCLKILCGVPADGGSGLVLATLSLATACGAEQAVRQSLSMLTVYSIPLRSGLHYRSPAIRDEPERKTSFRGWRQRFTPGDDREGGEENPQKYVINPTAHCRSAPDRTTSMVVTHRISSPPSRSSPGVNRCATRGNDVFPFRFVPNCR